MTLGRRNVDANTVVSGETPEQQARGARALEARVSEMYSLYERGASLGEVGRSVGRSGSWVKQVFTRHGLEVRPYELAMRLHREGASSRAIEADVDWASDQSTDDACG